MMEKEDVGGQDPKSRSLSVDEVGMQRVITRDRELSIDLHCTAFPDHLEELYLQPIVKSGWLDKTPPKGGRRFQRRWVQLCSDYLRYFQNNKEVYSKRMVSLAYVSGVVRVGDQRFELITQGRTFLFRAGTNQQREDWLTSLWKVLGSRHENSSAGVPCVSAAVSIEGYLEMVSPRTKLYIVIKDKRVYIFRNHQEYLHGIGITDINMGRASVREAGRSFSIITPYRTFSFMAESETECQRWCACMILCVSSSPSSAQACDKDTSVESSPVCAGCGSALTAPATVHQSVMCEICAGPAASEAKAAPPRCHSGYLFKVASSSRPFTEHKPRAEFSQRWCYLCDGVFSYYKTEQSSSRCGSIKTSDIICLSFRGPGEHGYEHTFELYTDGGRVYLFGADDITAIEKWIEAIAMAVLPAPLSDVCGPCDRLGRLCCAEGSSGIGWFCLKGFNLQILLQESVQNIDLRKLHTLTLCNSDSDMVLGWRGGRVHVHADRRPHFQGWLNSIRLSVGADDQPLSLQQLTESGIPIIIHRCLDYITRHGLMSPGIYRKSGVNSRVSTLLENFQHDARSVCVTEEYTVDDVANTMKRFFREVREGVFNGKGNTHSWLSTTEIPDFSKRIRRYQSLLFTLPEVNRETLKALLNHLYCVQSLSEVNQMTIRNLAIVFGPTLFQTDGTDSRTSGVVEDMIQGYCALFSVPEAELQKQLDATSLILKKLTDQVSTIRAPSHTICAIHLDKIEEGAELLMQVGDSITAEKLVLEALEMRGILPASGELWSCFETREEMERELHYKEKVLPVYYSLSPQSHLLVRKNHYISDMKDYLKGNQEVGKLGTLRVCEVKGDKGKSFSSRHCELSSGTFRMYRELQGSHCEREWPVHELKVYQGYRSKLQPQTSWGFTLFYGQQQWYFCCENENEFVEWLATFMSLQHDGNLP